MTDKHTAEPWVAEKEGREVTIYHGDPNKPGCDIVVLSEYLGIDDARRIVACVNACKGLTTKYLESIYPEFLCETVDAIQAQDPLAELRELEGEPEDDGPEGGGSIRA